MTWGRLDDSFYDHPKVRGIPRPVRNAACGLYWRAVSLSNRHLTDGRLTLQDVELIDGTMNEVAALVTARLWRKASNGYRIHDFLEFNKSKAEVLEDRQKRAEAGRLGGLAKARSKRLAPC